MTYFLAMLLGATSAVMVWSGIYNQNGFKEVGNLIAGKPSFIPEAQGQALGQGGSLTGAGSTETPTPGGSSGSGAGGGGGGAW